MCMCVCVGAALDCMKEGITVSPQIMIPLVCSDHEVSFIVPIIRNAYALVCEQYSSVYGDQVGAIILGYYNTIPVAQYLHICSMNSVAPLLSCSVPLLCSTMNSYLSDYVHVSV